MLLSCLFAGHALAQGWTTTKIHGAVGLFSVWGSSAHNVYVNGFGLVVNDLGLIAGAGVEILRFNGLFWNTDSYNSNLGVPLHMWGSSATDIFMVGGRGRARDVFHPLIPTFSYPFVTRYNGLWRSPSYWNPLDKGSLNNIWGSSSKDVFAVGYGSAGGAQIIHFDGKTWSPMPVTGAVLFGVWGSSGTDVFAVGANGTIVHYDGTSWSEMNIGSSTEFFNDIWGSSGNDVFAVGCNMDYPDNMTSHILHYNGESWSQMEIPSSGQLHALWGSSSSDVYAVGDEGAILHYNGASWSAIEAEPNADFSDVWGSSGTDVYVVGTVLKHGGRQNSTGLIMHYGGGM